MCVCSLLFAHHIITRDVTVSKTHNTKISLSSPWYDIYCGIFKKTQIKTRKKEEMIVIMMINIMHEIEM